MQRRRLGGGKIADQTGLHPPLPGWLGEQEKGGTAGAVTGRDCIGTLESKASSGPPPRILTPGPSPTALPPTGRGELYRGDLACRVRCAHQKR